MAYSRAEAEADGWAITLEDGSAEASRDEELVSVFSETPEASLLALLAPVDVAALAAAQEAARAAALTGAANRAAMADRASKAAANLIAAADALAANTATPAQQRAALELACRTTARLVRLVLNELDQAS